MAIWICTGAVGLSAEELLCVGKEDALIKYSLYPSTKPHVTASTKKKFCAGTPLDFSDGKAQSRLRVSHEQIVFQ
jgi:hypothetical protein